MVILKERIQSIKLRKKSIFKNYLGGIKNKNRTFAPLFYKNNEGAGKMIEIKFWFSFVFAIILLSNPKSSFSKGIIISNQADQTELFQKGDSVVLQFAKQIADTYTEAVIYLGNDLISSPGNIYSSPACQHGLFVFCRELQYRGVVVILGMFNSVGGDAFDELYNKHRDLIIQNFKKINALKIGYDGIAVDIQWINKTGKGKMELTEQKKEVHSKEFKEILTLIRKNLNAKKKTYLGPPQLYYFCSLVESEKENSNRGYNIKELKKIGAQPFLVLNPAESGFVIEKDKLNPSLSETQFLQLKSFYNKMGWKTVVSLAPAYIIRSNSEVKTISTQTFQKIINESGFTNLGEERSKAYSISMVQLQDSIVQYQDSIKKERNYWAFIYKFKMNSRMINQEDFVWEYFSMERWFNQHELGYW